MPARKRKQTDAMLYTLITFVALFIIATTVAVIYYVKAEDHRTNAAKLQSQIDELASPAELRKGLRTIVGAKKSTETYLGKMVDYLDTAVRLIIGAPLEETLAEGKVNSAKAQSENTFALLAREYANMATIDPNTDGLIRVIQKLKIELDNVTNTKLNTQAALQNLQNRFDDAMTATFQKEQTLLAEKDKYQTQVNEIKQDYQRLETMLTQSSEQRVQTLMGDLNQEKATHKNTRQELLKTQAELGMAQDRMKRCQNELARIVPPPDSNVAAYKPDGKIILIDDQAKIVHLNIGSDDHVYPGLTFPVYDKTMPIPKDGKGKAEVEVFDVSKNISAARIIASKTKRPIVLDDIVANLIWDSDKTNVFVIVGQFDLDSDGSIDYDAFYKIKTLIEKWGGRVADTLSIETDFLVLGTQPRTLIRPTFEQIEVDPAAMEKYEDSLKNLAYYNEVQNQARALSIPVFNYERFLFFLGYKTQSRRAGAF